MILGNGVREPGYVQLPICTASKVRQEARGRWWKFNEEDPSKPFEKITDTFPCGDGALTDDEMASFGF